MTNYQKALDFIQEKNMCVWCKTGKTFGKLVYHFIIGGGEMCLMANADGSLKIFWEAGNRKHEKKVDEFKGSETMYRSGNADGNNSPMVFATKGKNRKNYFSDNFLNRGGCAPGSTIFMTGNSFMTYAAW